MIARHSWKLLLRVAAAAVLRLRVHAHSSGLAHRPRGTQGVHPPPRHRQQAKTHAPTDVAALRALQQHSPLASLVLRWRSMQYVLSKCARCKSSSLFARLRKSVRRKCRILNLSDGMQNQSICQTESRTISMRFKATRLLCLPSIQQTALKLAAVKVAEYWEDRSCRICCSWISRKAGQCRPKWAWVKQQAEWDMSVRICLRSSVQWTLAFLQSPARHAETP